MTPVCVVHTDVMEVSYECDDGKDPAKREYIASLGDAAV
jgi:hypothetical protein